MPTTGLTVAVIGAGTGGMCLAHGLRRAGIDVTVYERDRTRTGGLNGYRVGISPNGARALKACLAPDLFDTFVATTAAPYDHLMTYAERSASWSRCPTPISPAAVIAPRTGTTTSAG
jgi:2-polyprenyl-6-methoxyphenol hydroxylase-like FAD-dependent oxidoreductase